MRCQSRNDHLKGIGRKRHGLGIGVNRFHFYSAFFCQPFELPQHVGRGVHPDDARGFTGKRQGKMAGTTSHSQTESNGCDASSSCKRRMVGLLAWTSLAAYWPAMASKCSRADGIMARVLQARKLTSPVFRYKTGGFFLPRWSATILFLRRPAHDLSMHGLLEKFAGAGQIEIPVLQQRRPPFGIITPGHPTDALCLQDN